jgi:hypothetical protein
MKENQSIKKGDFRCIQPLIVSGRFSCRLVDMKEKFSELVLFQNCIVPVLLTVVV